MLRKIILKISGIAVILVFVFLIFDCDRDGSEKQQTKDFQTQQVDNLITIPDKRLKLSELRQINEDVEAWINVPGTAIDFPVMKWVSVNNDQKSFYDRKDEYKNYSFEGSIYSGNGVVFSPFEKLSNNLILHGHNLDDNPDGKKFAQLVKFQDIEFAKKTPYVFITTIDKQLVYQIFAVFFTDINFQCYWIGLDEKKQAEMIADAQQRSEYIYPDIQVSGTDKILTLSTCTYKYGRYQSVAQKNTRFVIQGKLIDNTGDLPLVARIQKNQNPKQPAIPQN